MKLKLFHRIGLLITFLCIFIAGPSRAGLPPEAQAAIKKGIMAAKEGEWMIAVQSFQDARKIAPDAPEIYYNLGLAESKLPGRELRAIAWFGAYLAAATNPPNAAAVNDAIAGLQIKNQGNLSRLIKSAQDAADDKTGHADIHLSSVARLWAESGDMTKAMKVVDLMPDTYFGRKDSALMSVVDGQARLGDFPGAQKTADLIQEVKQKSEAEIDIARSEVMVGDLADTQGTLAIALRTADLIYEREGFVHAGKDSVLADIAQTQAQAGDVAGAQRTVDRIQDAGTKSWCQSRLDDIQKNIKAYQHSNSATASFIKVSDWLSLLDGTFSDRVSLSLNIDRFLDLAGYLTAQHSDETLFNVLEGTAATIVEAQNVIDKMLKQQATQQAKP